MAGLRTNGAGRLHLQPEQWLPWCMAGWGEGGGARLAQSRRPVARRTTATPSTLCGVRSRGAPRLAVLRRITPRCAPC